MEKFLLNIVANINTYLSNYILIILLIGVGLFYSIKTRFVQVRCFGEGWKRMFANFSLNGEKQKSGLSSWSRCYLLDVGYRILRYGYHLR